MTTVCTLPSVFLDSAELHRDLLVLFYLIFEVVKFNAVEKTFSEIKNK